eukprot:TRINITY_DN2401_c0_g2_i2.p1 TRINITY_DN2401_c0_g2~~TRINITY_DN2401_c0_g2_i2.p1  ORF type:complete len:147 (-),score=45.38 TRINITY_DN2401_c0_g2_i2:395-835(-)
MFLFIIMCFLFDYCVFFFFFQAEDGIRDAQESRGLGDVYKRQVSTQSTGKEASADMIEVILNDRLGKKIRVKCKCVLPCDAARAGEHGCDCSEDDTIGDLKKLTAAQCGTRPEKIRIQKWYLIYKDSITLEDYEIHDGMGLELYYN